MATRRQKIEVGAFLAAASALVVVVLLALMGVRRSPTVSYRIEFQGNVAGLAEGSKVTYQGVPVGQVTDIVITEDNVICAKIDIEPRKFRARKDLQAKLTMESVFGPIAIDLHYPGDHHQDPLPPGALIPAATSLRERIETDIPRTLEKLAIVMARLDNTLAAIEPKRVAQTIENLGSAVERFDATLAKIKPEDVETLVRDIDHLLKSTDQALGELRGQTKQLTTTLQDAVKQGSTDVAATSRKIGESLDKLKEATERTTSLVESVHKVVQENRESVTVSMTRLRSILDKADKQFATMDLPAAEKDFRDAANKVSGAADTIARSRDDLRRSLDNVERSVTRTLDELERTLGSARRLIDYLERDPSSIIRGKSEPGRK